MNDKTTNSANPQSDTNGNDFWIPVFCGAAILTIGIGARQSFGIFQKPIAADLNVGREVWSFANALAVSADGPALAVCRQACRSFGTAPNSCSVALSMSRLVMIGFATESTLLTVGNIVCGHWHGRRGVRADFWRDHPANASEKRSMALGVDDRRRLVRAIRNRAVSRHCCRPGSGTGMRRC